MVDRIPGGNELLDPKKLIQKADITTSMTAADLGCGGSGVFTLQAAKAVGGKGTIYAVDVLKSVLASVITKAKMQSINNVRTVWSNLEIYGATKIQDGALDRAMLINTLFQTKKYKEILQEAKRMLRREGMLLIVDWKPHGAPFGPLEKNRVQPDKIERIAKDLDFQVIEKFDAGPYHYGLLFTKTNP